MQSTGSISDKILRGITHPNPPPAVPQIRHIHHGLLVLSVHAMIMLAFAVIAEG